MDAAVVLTVRDGLTEQRLLAAARRRGVTSRPIYEPTWWDGGCRVACLRVRIDGRWRRVVETQGQVVVLPGSARAARVILHMWRRTPLGRPLRAAGATPGPAVTGTQRRTDDVRVRWAPVYVPAPRTAAEPSLHFDDLDIAV